MSAQYNLRTKKSLSANKKEKEAEKEKSMKNKLKCHSGDDNLGGCGGDKDDDSDEDDDEYETEYETEEDDEDDNDDDENDEDDDEDDDDDTDNEGNTGNTKNKSFDELLTSFFKSKTPQKTQKPKKEKDEEYTTNLVEQAIKYSSKPSKFTEKEEDILVKNLLKHLQNKKKAIKDVKPEKKIKKEEKVAKDTEDKENDEDDEDDEDFDPTENKKSKKTDGSNDIFMTITYNDDYEDEEDIEEILNNENEDIDSEDEKTFMSEVYQRVEDPPLLIENKKSKLNTKKKDNKNTKSTKKLSKDDKTVTSATTTTDAANREAVETEYKELVSLKKQLAEKLEKKPNSKILLNAIKECNKEIKQLVTKSRRNNTKEYYNLSNNEPKHTGELEYFKTKLSNKEQLKIMDDLKAINEHIQIVKPYRLTLLQSNIPSKYKATVMQKLNMLQTMEPGDNEYHKLKMWIDAFMRIPFNVYKDLSISINDGLENCNNFMTNAKKTLDECTYGLDDAKMQILQLIGQWLTNPNAMGTAIAIYGPKGTGKTSLSKDGISKIFGREFAFISLGGSGDSSYLEGHSYTYEGSTWGKIAQILIESKCMNPIIYFDELDKISDTPRGQEITGILTHLTDTTQNTQFRDKYFNEVELDLSRCLFIFSYNDENAVNPILRDRMYRIQTKGYDMKEKTIIAKKYLLPKIREQVNFKEGDIVIPDDVIQYIISNESLTQKEEGVRNLKRCLEIIHTKLNLFRLMHNTEENSILGKNIQLKVEFPYTITRADVDVLIKNEDKKNQSLLAMYV